LQAQKSPFYKLDVFFLQTITLSRREIVYDNEMQLLAIDEAMISIEGEQ
jgi:hypothetical protein